MDKKDLVKASLVKFVSDKAFEALETGKGIRAIGVEPGIKVGSTYKICGIDFDSNWFSPDDKDYSASELNEMSEDEKREAGCQFREWFTFKTNNGNLSFSAVMGVQEMFTDEFWKDVETKSVDFDVTKIFKTSNRTPSMWIKEGCDDLIGKTLTCVATKTYMRGSFPVNVRAFVVTD